MKDVKFNEAFVPLVKAMNDRKREALDRHIILPELQMAAAVVEAMGIPAQMVASEDFRADLLALVDAHKQPADGSASAIIQAREAIPKARTALERVFYWLGMGDEGPEASLPLPSEVSEDKGISELLEEVRLAARGLGGLQEEDKDECEGPIPDPPACGAPTDNAT